jgi:hypothetical protein
LQWPMAASSPCCRTSSPTIRKTASSATVNLQASAGGRPERHWPGGSARAHHGAGAPPTGPEDPPKRLEGRQPRMAAMARERPSAHRVQNAEPHGYQTKKRRRGFAAKGYREGGATRSEPGDGSPSIGKTRRTAPRPPSP